MQWISPAEALYLRDVMLPVLETARRTTRQVFELIPAPLLDYRPAPAYKTARQLSAYIIGTELFFLEGIVLGGFPASGMVPFDLNAPADETSAADQPADFSAQITFYEIAHKDMLQRLQKLDGEQLARPLPFRRLMTLPAVQYLTLTQFHTAHYLRELLARGRVTSARTA
ncbi:MAG: DinB family protein [Blastocatellia bacterium]